MLRTVLSTSLLLPAVCFGASALSATAQTAPAHAASKPAPKVVPSGSVSGRVTCTDTQRPAHYADIFLIPKAAAQDSSTALIIQARTKEDGTFTVKSVPVGDYFVIARLAGYILPISRDESAEDPSRADLAKILAKFPQVHVTADADVTAETALSPGASIAGHIEFDDGTPVVGQWVEIQSADDHDPWRQYLGVVSDLSLHTHQDTTDDEGRYRFAGLLPGKYYLFTVIQPEMDQRRTGMSPFAGFIRQSFTVYAPNVFRKSLSKPVEVAVTDHHDNDNIIVSLRNTHTVSGKVLAASDQHPLNYGSVSLRDPDDEKDFSRTTPLDHDGTFHFDDVPEGSYNLSVTRAAEVQPGGNPYTPVILHAFADGKAKATVTGADLVVENVVLEEAKKAEAASPAKAPAPKK